MTNPIIKMTNLTLNFGETRAENNLSIEVEDGEIFGFPGHNGAGKTTTVRLLNGIYKPTLGNSHVLGFDPQLDGLATNRKKWQQCPPV